MSKDNPLSKNAVLRFAANKKGFRFLDDTVELLRIDAKTVKFLTQPG